MISVRDIQSSQIIIAFIGVAVVVALVFGYRNTVQPADVLLPVERIEYSIANLTRHVRSIERTRFSKDDGELLEIQTKAVHDEAKKLHNAQAEQIVVFAEFVAEFKKSGISSVVDERIAKLEKDIMEVKFLVEQLFTDLKVVNEFDE